MTRAWCTVLTDTGVGLTSGYLIPGRWPSTRPESGRHSIDTFRVVSVPVPGEMSKEMATTSKMSGATTHSLPQDKTRRSPQPALFTTSEHWTVSTLFPPWAFAWNRDGERACRGTTHGGLNVERCSSSRQELA